MFNVGKMQYSYECFWWFMIFPMVCTLYTSLALLKQFDQIIFNIHLLNIMLRGLPWDLHSWNSQLKIHFSYVKTNNLTTQYSFA
jgi:hypothetical protein